MRGVQQLAGSAPGAGQAATAPACCEAPPEVRAPHRKGPLDGKAGQEPGPQRDDGTPHKAGSSHEAGAGPGAGIRPEAGSSHEAGTRPEAGSRQEVVVARAIRARGLVAGHPPARVAADIYDECAGEFGTTWVRAYRLAHGIALADVVAQVKAWYESEGRTEPKFSETLLSAYESGMKRPGPEYLHFLCAVYRADPADLGLIGNCLCGQSHRQPAGAGWPATRATGDPVPSGPAAAGQAPS
ncbi:MAG: hypothetical protein J2P35_01495, partial [Actinobacteria bacterium]|nr:hypothetical protein [Actinomycetota bacterium]